jgi:hypothetical protein
MEKVIDLIQRMKSATLFQALTYANGVLNGRHIKFVWLQARATIRIVPVMSEAKMTY